MPKSRLSGVRLPSSLALGVTYEKTGNATATLAGSGESRIKRRRKAGAFDYLNQPRVVYELSGGATAGLAASGARQVEKIRAGGSRGVLAASGAVEPGIQRMGSAVAQLRAGGSCQIQNDGEELLILFLDGALSLSDLVLLGAPGWAIEEAALD